MFGTFGSSSFGSPWYIPVGVPPSGGGSIAVLGDTSDHGGIIIMSNQDGSFLVEGKEVAVHGAQLSCPIHGVVTIFAITSRSRCNGKLILTKDAVAECGALITPPDRGVYFEE